MSGQPTSGLALARHYLGVERPQAALDALSNVSGDELADTEYWAVRAEALIQLEQYADGAEAARRGLEHDPEDIELLDLLAICELGQDNLDAAEEAIDAALELAPESPILLAHEALILARGEWFEEAREAIGEAMRVDPESLPVMRVRAQVAVLAGDEEADRYVEDLLEANPQDGLGHALRGGLAAQRSQFKRASQAFDEAARLDPRDAEIVGVAREARVGAHPALAPLRVVSRFGRWRSYFLYLTIISVLAVARLETLRYAVIAVWLTIVILSWFGPPVVRRLQRRKYGGF